jgi:hypothetical protein
LRVQDPNFNVALDTDSSECSQPPPSSTAILSPPSSSPRLVAIPAEDVAKVEAGLLPLVPSCEMPWLVAVLRSPAAALFSVCSASVRRLGELRYSEDEARALGAYRAVCLAARRFPESRALVEGACRVLRHNATFGPPETSGARRDAMLRAGAGGALCDALRAHGEASKAVASAASGAVQSLAMGDEVRKDELAGCADLVRALVAAARAHPGLLSARSALVNIVMGADEERSDARRRVVVALGGAEALRAPPGKDSPKR